MLLKRFNARKPRDVADADGKPLQLTKDIKLHNHEHHKKGKGLTNEQKEKFAALRSKVFLCGTQKQYSVRWKTSSTEGRRQEKLNEYPNCNRIIKNCLFRFRTLAKISRLAVFLD